MNFDESKFYVVANSQIKGPYTDTKAATGIVLSGQELNTLARVVSSCSADQLYKVLVAVSNMYLTPTDGRQFRHPNSAETDLIEPPGREVLDSEIEPIDPAHFAKVCTI